MVVLLNCLFMLVQKTTKQDEEVIENLSNLEWMASHNIGREAKSLVTRIIRGTIENGFNRLNNALENLGRISNERVLKNLKYIIEGLNANDFPFKINSPITYEDRKSNKITIWSLFEPCYKICRILNDADYRFELARRINADHRLNIDLSHSPASLTAQAMKNHEAVTSFKQNSVFSLMPCRLEELKLTGGNSLVDVISSILPQIISGNVCGRWSTFFTFKSLVFSSFDAPNKCHTGEELLLDALDKSAGSPHRAKNTFELFRILETEAERNLVKLGYSFSNFLKETLVLPYQCRINTYELEQLQSIELNCLWDKINLKSNGQLGANLRRAIDFAEEVKHLSSNDKFAICDIFGNKIAKSLDELKNIHRLYRAKVDRAAGSRENNIKKTIAPLPVMLKLLTASSGRKSNRDLEVLPVLDNLLKIANDMSEVVNGSSSTAITSLSEKFNIEVLNAISELLKINQISNSDLGKITYLSFSNQSITDSEKKIVFKNLQELLFFAQAFNQEFEMSLIEQGRVKSKESSTNKLNYRDRNPAQALKEALIKHLNESGESTELPALKKDSADTTSNSIAKSSESIVNNLIKSTLFVRDLVDTVYRRNIFAIEVGLDIFPIENHNSYFPRQGDLSILSDAKLVLSEEKNLIEKLSSEKYFEVTDMPSFNKFQDQIRSQLTKSDLLKVLHQLENITLNDMMSSDEISKFPILHKFWKGLNGINDEQHTYRSKELKQEYNNIRELTVRLTIAIKINSLFVQQFRPLVQDKISLVEEIITSASKTAGGLTKQIFKHLMLANELITFNGEISDVKLIAKNPVCYEIVGEELNNFLNSRLRAFAERTSERTSEQTSELTSELTSEERKNSVNRDDKKFIDCTEYSYKYILPAKLKKVSTSVDAISCLRHLSEKYFKIDLRILLKHHLNFIENYLFEINEGKELTEHITFRGNQILEFAYGKNYREQLEKIILHSAETSQFFIKIITASRERKEQESLIASQVIKLPALDRLLDTFQTNQAESQMKNNEIFNQIIIKAISELIDSMHVGKSELINIRTCSFSDLKLASTDLRIIFSNLQEMLCFAWGINNSMDEDEAACELAKARWFSVRSPVELLCQALEIYSGCKFDEKHVKRGNLDVPIDPAIDPPVDKSNAQNSDVLVSNNLKKIKFIFYSVNSINNNNIFANQLGDTILRLSGPQKSIKYPAITEIIETLELKQNIDYFFRRYSEVELIGKVTNLSNTNAFDFFTDDENQEYPRLSKLLSGIDFKKNSKAGNGFDYDNLVDAYNEVCISMNMSSKLSKKKVANDPNILADEIKLIQSHLNLIKSSFVKFQSLLSNLFEISDEKIFDNNQTNCYNEHIQLEIIKAELNHFIKSKIKSCVKNLKTHTKLRDYQYPELLDAQENYLIELNTITLVGIDLKYIEKNARQAKLALKMILSEVYEASYFDLTKYLNSIQELKFKSGNDYSDVLPLSGEEILKSAFGFKYHTYLNSNWQENQSEIEISGSIYVTNIVDDNSKISSPSNSSSPQTSKPAEQRVTLYEQLFENLHVPTTTVFLALCGLDAAEEKKSVLIKFNRHVAPIKITRSNIAETKKPVSAIETFKDFCNLHAPKHKIELDKLGKDRLGELFWQLCIRTYSQDYQRMKADLYAELKKNPEESAEKEISEIIIREILPLILKRMEALTSFKVPKGLKFKPYPHQIEAIQQARQKPIIVHDTGTGKTELALMLLKMSETGGMLCTTAGLNPYLVERIFKSLKIKRSEFFQLDATTEKLSPEQFIARLEKTKYISASYQKTNRLDPESFEALQGWLKNKYKILDEVHLLDNPDSWSCQTIRKLASEFTLLLTATPFQHRMERIATLLHLALPNEYSDPKELIEELKNNKPLIKALLHAHSNILSIDDIAKPFTSLSDTPAITQIKQSSTPLVASLNISIKPYTLSFEHSIYYANLATNYPLAKKEYCLKDDKLEQFTNIRRLIYEPELLALGPPLNLIAAIKNEILSALAAGKKVLIAGERLRPLQQLFKDPEIAHYGRVGSIKGRNPSFTNRYDSSYQTVA